MENNNAVMIDDGIPQPQRLKRLNEIAIHQMRVLSKWTTAICRSEKCWGEASRRAAARKTI